jgi:hypothetical protein
MTIQDLRHIAALLAILIHPSCDETTKRPWETDSCGRILHDHAEHQTPFGAS